VKNITKTLFNNNTGKTVCTTWNL